MKRHTTHLTLAIRESFETVLFVTAVGWFSYAFWAIASLPALPGI